MKPYKNVEEVTFQILYPVEGDATVLEFLDEKGNSFMEINIDGDSKHQFVIYSSREHISLPLSEVLKGIEIAKQRVVNVRTQDDSQ